MQHKLVSRGSWKRHHIGGKKSCANFVSTTINYVSCIYKHVHLRYNKTENLKAGSKEMMEFTHLILEADNVQNRYAFYETHDVQIAVEGFTGIDVNPNRFPPILIKSDTKVLVLKKLAMNSTRT